jgi:hypothetical protein
MVIVVMNTEKVAVFAMATMVPWHPTSPVGDDLQYSEGRRPMQKGAYLVSLNQQDFSQG